MTAPYLARLLCISFAAFFLVHLSIAVLVSLLTPTAVRLAERLRADRAARMLLALRLAPMAVAAAVVAGLCVPSYLWLEPMGTAEELGFACLFTAVLGVACWSIAIRRSLQAVLRSVGYSRYCRMVGRRANMTTEAAPVWVVDSRAPFLALAGIVHPRLLVSSEVLAGLSADQLAAALRHENAHRLSHDNLKRLLLLLAPNALPFWRNFAALERAWARFTEWAADDQAVAGDERRSLSLASALVRVARMGACPQAPPLVTSLLADDGDLEKRVDRLLSAPPAGANSSTRWEAALGGILAAGLMVATLQSTILLSVHSVLERLAH